MACSNKPSKKPMPERGSRTKKNKDNKKKY